MTNIERLERQFQVASRLIFFIVKREADVFVKTVLRETFHDAQSMHEYLTTEYGLIPIEDEGFNPDSFTPWYKAT